MSRLSKYLSWYIEDVWRKRDERAAIQNDIRKIEYLAKQIYHLPFKVIKKDAS